MRQAPGVEEMCVLLWGEWLAWSRGESRVSLEYQCSLAPRIFLQHGRLSRPGASDGGRLERYVHSWHLRGSQASLPGKPRGSRPCRSYWEVQAELVTVCRVGKDVFFWTGCSRDECCNKKPRKRTWREEHLAFADMTYRVDVANALFNSEKAKKGWGLEMGRKEQSTSNREGPSASWHGHY